MSSRGLIVLGFPSNSFNQESNNDNEVKKFCEVNFNINFPLSTIINVKGENAHEIFKWAKKIMEIQLFQNGIFIKSWLINRVKFIKHLILLRNPRQKK